VSNPVLREATEQDLSAVAQLWQRLDSFHRELGFDFPEPTDAAKVWAEAYRRTLGRFSFVWLAEQDGEVVSFLLARIKHTPAFLGGVSVGEISDLYVEERLRGQGIGTGLVKLAIEWLRAKEVHSIEVQILAGNEGGLEFWMEQGFEPDLSVVRMKVGG
jgi:GNAT superfamily N-acetyltransferase